MSVKIMISYEYDRELQSVLETLSPMVKKHKVAKKKEGKYYNAYVEMKELESVVNTGV